MNATSHRCTPGRANCLSPCTTGHPQIAQSTPGCLNAFSPGVRQYLQGSNPAMNSTSKTPVFEFLQKLMKISPSHFPSQWLWGSILFVHPGQFLNGCFHAVFMLLACLEQCSALWALSQTSLLTFKTPNFRDLVWQVFWGSVLPCWY